MSYVIQEVIGQNKKEKIAYKLKNTLLENYKKNQFDERKRGAFGPKE